MGYHIPYSVENEVDEPAAPQLYSGQQLIQWYPLCHLTHVVSCDLLCAVVVSLEAGDGHHIHMAAVHRIRSLDHTDPPWEDHNHGELSGPLEVREIAGVDNRHSIHTQHPRILHSHIHGDCHIHNPGHTGLAPDLPRRGLEEDGEGRIALEEGIFVAVVGGIP